MIGRIALGMATVEALKGATLVGDNVLDSEIGALDTDAAGNLVSDQQKPFISVYVEGAKLEGAAVLRALHKSGPTDLIIEIGIAATMVGVDPETLESEVIPGIPATDAAFEFYLGLVGRQVVNALSDPGSAWAEIWRGLMAGVLKIERRRTGDASNGVRIAAHQLVITVDLLPDPVYGEPIASTSIWARFFAKLAEDESEITAAKLAALRALLGAPDDVSPSEAQRRRLGLTLEEVRALFGDAVPAIETVVSAVTHETVR